MNKDFEPKRVIFFSAIILTLILTADYFIKPGESDYFRAAGKFINQPILNQTVANDRLYVNVWRTVKNEYVDETFNAQNWSRWRNRYAGKIKTSDDANVAINTMLASLNDPYTKFLQSGEYKKQRQVLASKISGVGIIFDKSGDNVVVNHVLNESPAKGAKILPGDEIVSINGEKTSAADLERIIKNMEDGKEEKVTLVIKRDNTLIEKELEKTEVYIKTMGYKTYGDGISLIRLTNINGEKAIETFREILLKTNDSKALIIDLRNNYGGLLANAMQMADLMLDNEKILNIKTRNNSVYKVYSAPGRIYKPKPVIVLINGYTASAAEIFAGILHENTGAMLIGENTYGKNSIQQVIPMHNNTGLVLTCDRYLLPSGLDIYSSGLTPDIVFTQKTSAVHDNDDMVIFARELMHNGIRKNLVMSE